MGVKFNQPTSHYLGIDEIDLNEWTLGITAYGSVKRVEHTGDIQELFNIYGGGIGFGFLGWDASGDFYADCTGGVPTFFNVNPPLGEFIYWSVTMLNGLNSFVCRWWYEDGTLGDMIELDCAVTDALINITLMGFPGNEQGVKGTLAKWAVVNAILDQIELESEFASQFPIDTDTEVCSDGNSLVDSCNGYTFTFSTGTGDITVDENDNPDIDLWAEFDESIPPNAISNLVSLEGTLSDIQDTGLGTPDTDWLTRTV